MAEFETDEQQLETLRKWWQENGRGVLVGVVLGLSIVGGWRGWLWHQETQAEKASVIYHQLLRNLDEQAFAAVGAQAEQLMDDFSTTPYAQLAALGDARAAVAEQDYARARASLDWVIENARQENVRHIARLRLARVLRQAGELDAALALLEADFPSPFQAAVEDLRGDLYLARGETDNAREAYLRALAAPYSSVDREVLQMKYNELRVDASAS